MDKVSHLPILSPLHCAICVSICDYMGMALLVARAQPISSGHTAPACTFVPYSHSCCPIIRHEATWQHSTQMYRHSMWRCVSALLLSCSTTAGWSELPDNAWHVCRSERGSIQSRRSCAKKCAGSDPSHAYVHSPQVSFIHQCWAGDVMGSMLPSQLTKSMKARDLTHGNRAPAVP